MVLKKILLLWLWVFFDGDDNYTLFGFTITTILHFLVTLLGSKDLGFMYLES